MSGRVAIFALVLMACGGAQRTAPADTTKQEVEKAETAERARQHDVARVHYEAAVAGAKDPESLAFARREFAETLVSWGEYPAAIAQLEGVLAVRPADAATWHDLGLLYHNKGEDPRAIEALRKSRELAPADPRPRITLAVLLWKRGEKSAAKSEYEQLRTLDLPDGVRAKVDWAIAELSK